MLVEQGTREQQYKGARLKRFKIAPWQLYDDFCASRYTPNKSSASLDGPRLVTFYGDEVLASCVVKVSKHS